MGRIQKGILGGFQGLVGTVVGGTWKGIDYIKSRPVFSNTDPTPRQLEQREKFKTVVGFLRPVLDLVAITFGSVSDKMTGYNAAMSYNYKKALTGTYPNLSVDYRFAAISDGPLPNVGTPASSAEPNSIIKFTWLNNHSLGKAKATDDVIMVVYCPEMNKAIYSVGNKKRSDLTGQIDATEFFDKVVHMYVACISDNGKLVATSDYTGQATVL